jgi:DNA polymerase III alpha subunit
LIFPPPREPPIGFGYASRPCEAVPSPIRPHSLPPRPNSSLTPGRRAPSWAAEPPIVPNGQSIRAPLTRVKGLTARTFDAMLDARERGPFTSLADFFRRVAPSGEELEAMIRAGGFDEFGETQTRQFFCRLNIC